MHGGGLDSLPAANAASAANTTKSASPAISVRLAPMRLDTQFATSIATAVTTR